MERHLARCSRCREEVAAFQAQREAAAGLADLPELPWNLVAAEMRANIRLGLSAGECVRPNESKSGLRMGWRPAVAMASIAALAVTGIILERPRIKIDREEAGALQTTSNSIGSETMRLMYPRAESVQLSASAGGSVQARYTDPSTSFMTVSEVDAQ
jgi:hypothetical protein